VLRARRKIRIHHRFPHFSVNPEHHEKIAQNSENQLTKIPTAASFPRVATTQGGPIELPSEFWVFLRGLSIGPLLFLYGRQKQNFELSVCNVSKRRKQDFYI